MVVNSHLNNLQMGKQKPKAAKPQVSKEQTFIVGVTIAGYGRVNTGDAYTSEIKKACQENNVSIEKFLK